MNTTPADRLHDGLKTTRILRKRRSKGKPEVDGPRRKLALARMEDGRTALKEIQAAHRETLSPVASVLVDHARKTLESEIRTLTIPEAAEHDQSASPSVAGIFITV